MKKIFSLVFVLLSFFLIVFFSPGKANAYCYESCDSHALCNQPSIYYCPNLNTPDPNDEDCTPANRPNCYWAGWVWHTGACCGASNVCSVDQLSCIPYFSTCKGVDCNNLGVPPCVEQPACALYNCIPTANLLNPGLCMLAPLPTPTSIPPTSTPTPAIFVSLSPTQGDTTTTFVLSGSGFPFLLNRYNLRLEDSNGNLITGTGWNLSPNSSGQVTQNFQVPQAGTITVLVWDTQTNNILWQTTITVTAVVLTPTPVPCGQECPANSPTSVCVPQATSCYYNQLNDNKWRCYCPSPTPIPSNTPTPPPPTSTQAPPPPPPTAPVITSAPPGGQWYQVKPPPNSVPVNVKPDNIVQFLFNLFVAIGIILALIFLLYGAIKWITSRGDKAALENARSHIIMAIVGLLLVILSWVIVNLIIKILGLSGLPSQITIPKFNTP